MTCYQCVKNFFDDGIELIFQAGQVYKGSDPDKVSNTGRTLMNRSSKQPPVFLTPAQVREHFKVLEEPVLVPDPYNDHEAEEYSYLLQPAENLSRGLVIATAITVALIAAGLYFAFLY